jgi:uncharacterized protein (UPF0335 family)
MQLNASGKEELKGYITRIERLRDEMADLASDAADLLKEAKNRGFDVPALRTVLKERAQKKADPELFENRMAVTDVYRQVCGLLDGKSDKKPEPKKEPEAPPPVVETAPPEVPGVFNRTEPERE